MAEYKNSKGIRCFEPDNTETTLYIQASWSNLTLEELMDRARDHFGQDVQLDQIAISAENIHTECLGLDYHDSSDWTDFLVLTLNQEQSA